MRMLWILVVVRGLVSPWYNIDYEISRRCATQTLRNPGVDGCANHLAHV